MQNSTSSTYTPSPKIVFENMDDEVIMINFEKGSYYSLHNTAAEIWNLIVTGCTIDEILTSVTQAYNESLATIQLPIIEFIQKLDAENLIIPTSTPANHSSPVLVPKQNKFILPELETYSDMNDLLMLDPIHDVDEVTGWPNRPL